MWNVGDVLQHVATVSEMVFNVGLPYTDKSGFERKPELLHQEEREFYREYHEYDAYDDYNAYNNYNDYDDLDGIDFYEEYDGYDNLDWA